MIDTPENATVGQLISEGLVKKGLSATGLADLLDVSHTHIINLKNDKAPSAKNQKPRHNPVLLDRIARALEIPIPVLRSAAGLLSPEQQKTLDPQREKYLSYYDELPSYAKRIAHDLVETLWLERDSLEMGTAAIDGQDGKMTKMRERAGGQKPNSGRKLKNR